MSNLRNLKKLLNVVEGFKSTGSSTPGKEFFVEDALSADQFQVGKIVRHGFPYEPTCMAFDPIQRLLAIGTKHGAIRLIGRPGVDSHFQHNSDAKVISIEFLVNEGALISVCSDDTVHLWRFVEQREAQLAHSLQFRRERLSCCRLSVASKWLYLGTDKGNIHFVNIDGLVLSGYTINWNKAIDTLQKKHPGAVVQLEENPLDSNKMLIGFETGLIVAWDLKTKTPETRFNADVPLTSLCWHYEGKLFLSSHTDGSLMTWSIQKGGQKAQSCIYPHATSASPNEKSTFSKIKKVDWLSVKSGVPFVIFSGGTPTSHGAAGGPAFVPPPSLTVMREKRLFVLQMDHSIVDFVPLCMSPYKCELEDPYAVAVLLQSDLVVIDLASPNFPWFENPYPMDIHESHVTSCHYLADCPPELIPAFYSIGRASKNAEGLSTKEWPVKGGNWGANLFSYSELIITGHGDGSIKFWDASQMSLNVLYKLRTSKFFERATAVQPSVPATPSNPPCSSRGDDSETASRASDTLNANVMQLREEHPYAIHLLHFCPDSRKLLVAGSTHVCLLNFSKRELLAEIPVLDVAIQYEVSGEDGGAETYAEDLGSSRDSSSRPSPAAVTLPHQSGSVGSYSSNTSERDLRVYIGIKSGQRRWPVGYQPELVCRLGCSEGGEPPPPITSICLNSSYQLIAVANECGIMVVDIAQKVCVVSYGTPDLYGSLDPYTRAPRSPGMKKEDPKSPTLEKSDSLSTSAVASKSATAALASMVARGFTAQQLALSHGASISSEACNDAEPDDAHASDVEVAGDCLAVDLSATPSASSESEAERVEEAPAPVANNGEEAVAGEVSDDDFEVLSNDVEDEQSNGTPVNGEDPHSRSQTPTPANPRPERPPSRPPPPRSPPPRPPPPRQSLTGGGRSLLRRMGLRLGSRKSADSPTVTPEKVETVDLLDLTDDDLPANKHRVVSVHPRLALPPDIRCLYVKKTGKETRKRPRRMRADKQESHFSRSCSSSTSSLDNLLISREPIKCMQFAEAFTKKGESTQCYPSLWIGTSLGSVLVLNLLLPSARSSQPVSIVSSGSIFRLHGEIMAIGFLDGAGELLAPLSERWDDAMRTVSLEETNSRTSTQSSSQRLTHQMSRAGASSSSSSTTLSSTGRQNTTSSLTSASSSSPGFDAGASAGVDRQMVVMVSEAQARVVALPSQTCLYKKKFTDKSYVIRADILRFKDQIPVLANYMANGRVTVFSLPSLRVLLDVECVPLNERVARTFSFSQCGQAVYFSTPSELEKLTISAAMCEQLPQMMPELYVTGLEIPEPPKKGFLQSLFSVGSNALDRDQLFGGKSSGKPMYGTAQQISSNRMNQLTGQAGGAMGEIAKTRQALIERGERLGELDKTTQEMADSAQAYSRSARLLAMKKEKEAKKWLPFLRD